MIKYTPEEVEEIFGEIEADLESEDADTDEACRWRFLFTSVVTASRDKLLKLHESIDRHAQRRGNPANYYDAVYARKAAEIISERNEKLRMLLDAWEPTLDDILSWS